MVSSGSHTSKNEDQFKAKNKEHDFLSIFKKMTFSREFLKHTKIFILNEKILFSYCRALWHIPRYRFNKSNLNFEISSISITSVFWAQCSSPNIYNLSVFTEKPYSKAVERNEVYVSIITSSHATSHDGKWRQNKPWPSTIWLDIGDVNDGSAVHNKTVCKCLPGSNLARMPDVS